ncbi:MAG TPA: phosphotransferase family protein [Streptosporangiaceae bacterium]|nr:phosphotransferase family protein [Streptosporangiaceae bacterium]
MTQGINVAEVTKWLVDHVDGLTAPLTFDLISGGRSNLTFGVTDAAGRKVVLRRPPISHVLSTAHDMGREYRVISALRDTPVPVPAALAFCTDESVNERSFYVMGFVDGHVLRGEAETEATLDEAARRAVAEDLVDVLVAIHQVDVDTVGLGDFARRDGYVQRQLRRWHGQFELSQQQAREVGVYRPVPLVDDVHRLLAERVPEQYGTSLVHGDYRLDNTIVSAGGKVQAVLDWELSTLGDPLADVGTFLSYWAEQAGHAPEAPTTMAQVAATALPGFPSRGELAERYATRSGRDLTNLGFYLAFAYWKLACIMEGVFVRYAAKAMGGDGSDAELLGQGVEDRARRALEALQA